MEADHPKDVIPELCRHYYNKDCMTGSGGAISMRFENKIYITPSGVEKEKVSSEDLFVIDPTKKAAEGPDHLKPSSCLPNFMHLYELRNADTGLHLHSKAAVMATLLNPGTHFKVSNLHMIKGIRNAITGTNFQKGEVVSVPIIDNYDDESVIQVGLFQALLENPETHAVLIRGHGYYVWGENWKQAKLMYEKLIIKVINHPLELTY